MAANQRAPSPNGPRSNSLLAALPPQDYARLAPALEIVPLKLKEYLHKPGEAIEHVYFPGGGFASIVTVLADGSMVEVATIGREGMLGVSDRLTVTPSRLRRDGAGREQTSVTGSRWTCSAARWICEARFTNCSTAYAQALVGFIMQSTACNAVHSVEQRLLALAADGARPHREETTSL